MLFLTTQLPYLSNGAHFKKRSLLILSLAILSLANCKGFPALGGGYEFDYDAVGDIAILKDKNMYIIDGILSYTNDSKFILLSQRPRDAVPECLKIKYQKPYNDCNAHFDKSTFLQYWIINKATHTTLGPFDEKTYLQKKIELGVPNDLKLEDISNWALR
jgi:hypothetical protein